MLRPYQNEIINNIRTSFRNGNNRVVLCAPTGSGKTRMFTFMVKEHIAKGGDALILTHRRELLKQAGSTFQNFDLNPEFIRAGFEPDLSQTLHVSMVETLYQRIHKKEYKELIWRKKLIVIDEAHLESFTKLFSYFNPETYVIGATATPHRKGKQQTSLDEFYTDLVQCIDTPELVELGFLSTPKHYGVHIDMAGLKRTGNDFDTKKYYEETKMYEGVVYNYEKLTPNKKAILFASNIESSQQVCNEFVNSGYNAKHIDSNMNTSEREDILTWYDKTSDAILCNCGIATTGFDQPDIEVVILYRATTSLPLYLQMCGRGSRITDTKKEFHILDFGNNVNRFKYWNHPREWSLHKVMGKEKEGAQPVKHCPECNYILPASAKVCEGCGHIFKGKVKESEFAELVLLEPKEVRQIAKSKDLETQARMAKEKLISPFWVLHNVKSVDEFDYFCQLMGYKKGFKHLNKDKFKVLQK
jgi:superfamily II DNA or RNA helicase